MDIGKEQRTIEVVPVDAPMFVPDFDSMPAAPAEPMPVEAPVAVPAGMAS